MRLLFILLSIYMFGLLCIGYKKMQFIVSQVCLNYLNFVPSSRAFSCVSKNRLEIHRIYRPILSKRLYQSVSSLLQYNGCPQKQFILKVLDKHKNKILVLPVCKCIVAPRRALILNFYPKFVRIFVTSILNQEPSLFGFCGKGVLVHSVLN